MSSGVSQPKERSYSAVCWYVLYLCVVCIFRRLTSQISLTLGIWVPTIFWVESVPVLGHAQSVLISNISMSPSLSLPKEELVF